MTNCQPDDVEEDHRQDPVQQGRPDARQKSLPEESKEARGAKPAEVVRRACVSLSVSGANYILFFNNQARKISASLR